MTFTEVMQQLETLGTEQNRTIYGRHGVTAPMFGVSFGNLNTLKKRVKRDHALAQQLWATGNHDARVFATMIADPRQVDRALLDAWVRDLDNYTLTDAFAGLVKQTPFAHELMEAWRDADDEWTARAGWHLLAHLAMQEKALPDDFFLPFLDTIEREIHSRPNYVRDAMNNALIAVGIRSDALEAAALGSAARIGTVEVDHGETNCKTPDATAYIHKTRARQKQRAASAPA